MHRVLFVLFAFGLAVRVSAREPDPSRWESAIARFEKEDAARRPPPGGVVFAGSSSIAGWRDLPKYFPGQAVLNRGFGGSTFPDVIHYLDRTVLKHRPRAVVLFCGSNDLATLQRTPEQVRDYFRNFVTKVHAAEQRAKIIYLAIHIPPCLVKLSDVI